MKLEGIKERLLGLLNPNKNAHSNMDTILALSELNNNTNNNTNWFKQNTNIGNRNRMDYLSTDLAKNVADILGFSEGGDTSWSESIGPSAKRHLLARILRNPAISKSAHTRTGPSKKETFQRQQDEIRPEFTKKFLKELKRIEESSKRYSDKGPESIGHLFEQGFESPMYKWGDIDYRPHVGELEDYYEGESPSVGQILKDALIQENIERHSYPAPPHQRNRPAGNKKQVIESNIETEWKGEPSYMLQGILNKMFDDAETGVLTDEQAKKMGSTFMDMYWADMLK